MKLQGVFLFFFTLLHFLTILHDSQAPFLCRKKGAASKSFTAKTAPSTALLCTHLSLSPRAGCPETSAQGQEVQVPEPWGKAAELCVTGTRAGPTKMALTPLLPPAHPKELFSVEFLPSYKTNLCGLKQQELVLFIIWRLAA